MLAFLIAELWIDNAKVDMGMNQNVCTDLSRSRYSIIECKATSFILYILFSMSNKLTASDDNRSAKLMISVTFLRGNETFTFSLCSYNQFRAWSIFRDDLHSIQNKHRKKLIFKFLKSDENMSSRKNSGFILVKKRLQKQHSVFFGLIVFWRVLYFVWDWIAEIGTDF